MGINNALKVGRTVCDLIKIQGRTADFQVAYAT